MVNVKKQMKFAHDYCRKNGHILRICWKRQYDLGGA